MANNISNSPTAVRVDQFPTAANVASTDLIVILYNAISNSAVANGSPSLRTIQMSNFCSNVVISQYTPANSSANGNPGNICYDANYFYICISPNGWLRTPIQTW